MSDGGELAIIPALNESGRVGAVVRALRQRHAQLDVLVIDDGSRDETGREARAAGALVATHPVRLGYGAALQTGYRFALRRQYARSVQLDGDGQHDPSDIETLMDPIRRGQANVVIGSRFGRRIPREIKALRRVGIWTLRSVAKLLTRQDWSDPTSGFVALDRRALELAASDMFPDDYPDIDVLIGMWGAGLRILEVPIAVRPRVGGRSMHSGFRPLYYAYKMSLAAGIAAVRARRSR